MSASIERYPVTWDKAVTIRKNDSEVNAAVDELKGDAFIKNESSGLLLPVDQWLLGLVSRVSDEGGSLFCDRPLEKDHPDYLQELYGQRLGIQTGSKHCAIEGKVDVLGVYLAANGFAEHYDPERGFSQDSKPTGIRTERDAAAAGSSGGKSFKPARLEALRTRPGDRASRSWSSARFQRDITG